jgi:hypothetical protein
VQFRQAVSYVITVPSMRGANAHAAQQGALAALQQGVAVGDTDEKLRGVLLHSLTGLHPVGVNMFLDAATIMRGWGREWAMAVWTAWHGPAAAAFFKELTRRCLLGV